MVVATLTSLRKRGMQNVMRVEGLVFGSRGRTMVFDHDLELVIIDPPDCRSESELMVGRTMEN